MQHFKLGQFFRRRYRKLIGNKYSPNTVYIQSTDFDRTIMSAQSNLAALFPPLDEEEIWNEKIKWQPVPVHTVPQRFDHVLFAGKTCPKYKAAYAEYMNKSLEVQRIYAEYSELFSFLTEKSGMNITTITDVYWLYNTLHIERDHNKSLVNTFRDLFL